MCFDELSGVLAEQLLGLGGITWREHLVPVQSSGTGAGLVLVQVHLACLTMHKLARPGEPEPLFAPECDFIFGIFDPFLLYVLLC